MNSDYMDIVMEDTMINPVNEGLIKGIKNLIKYRKEVRKIKKENKGKTEFQIQLPGFSIYKDIFYEGYEEDIPKDMTKEEFEKQIKDEFKKDIPTLKKALKEFENYYIIRSNDIKEDQLLSDNSDEIADDMINLLKNHRSSSKTEAYIVYNGKHDYYVNCNHEKIYKYFDEYFANIKINGTEYKISYDL